MAIDVQSLLTFNRGMVSKLALARVDVTRIGMSAEEQTNWMPRTLGPMQFRPGLGYLGSTLNDAVAYHLPFVFSQSETALVELTPGKLRIRKGSDDTIITRAGVTAVVTNGIFAGNVDGWTSASETGATSGYVSLNQLGLFGTGFNAAKRRQEVTVFEPGTQHALRIGISLGPVTLRVGSSAGGDQYINEIVLKTGWHSLTFTPTGNFHIEFSSTERYTVLVNWVTVEAAGDLVLDTDWTADKLSQVRFAQSRDVLFVSCPGVKQKRIERRDNDSWSLVDYEPIDGPFRIENTSPISIAPSALNGNISLTASAPVFYAGHVGALFRLTSFGQKVQATFTGGDQFSDPIKVTGVGATQREFDYSISGLDGSGTTATLQRSVGEIGAWLDVATFTANPSDGFNDGLDNQIIYYRVGIKAGDFGTGTLSLTIDYAKAGTIDGVARVTAYNSPTVVEAKVLKSMGGTDATTTWAESEWSPYRGYPSAVALFDGRLWWAGVGSIWGSISDAFDSFDDAQEGDAGPVSKSIADGPSDVVNWLFPGQRLLIGTDSATFSARSSSLDEPLTDAAFGLKAFSSQGTAAVDVARIDDEGFFVQKNGSRVYNMSIVDGRFDYTDGDATALIPEIGEPSIVRMGVQRQPDTRLHCVRSDGKVAVLVTDRAENVRCWALVETDGVIEDVVVLPGTIEDRVYYTVRRTINGLTKRYVERWAMMSEAQGAQLTALSDSYVIYSGAATTTIPVAHLEGKSVVVWADGKSVDDAAGVAKLHTVSNGQIILATAATYAVVGLPYQARYKSAKPAWSALFGSPLNLRKRLVKAGFILAWTHARGLLFGPSYDRLDPMPRVKDGAVVDADAIHEDFDDDAWPFPGDWSTDSRVCLVADSPRPATVMACTLTVEGHRSV